MEEEWKPVVGYEGLYEVSNIGNVRSIGIRGRQLKLTQDKYGYLCVSLYKNKKAHCKKVHRLVTSAFFGESPLTVNHIDGNKTNNNVSNLEYMASGENSRLAKCKPIIQYDKQGNFIREWDAMMDVERQLHIFVTGISACCKKRRLTAGGFVWRYKNE